MTSQKTRVRPALKRESTWDSAAQTDRMQDAPAGAPLAPRLEVDPRIHRAMAAVEARLTEAAANRVDQRAPTAIHHVLLAHLVVRDHRVPLEVDHEAVVLAAAHEAQAVHVATTQTLAAAQAAVVDGNLF